MIETKVCRVCGIEKSITEYGKSGKYYRNDCKVCHNKMVKEWAKRNKEYLNEKHKEYRQKNKDLYKEFDKRHYIKNRDVINERHKRYNANHKEEKKERAKKYYIKNKEKIKEKTKSYSLNRLKTDPMYRLKANVRKVILYSFKRKNKDKKLKTENILGCKIDFFTKYLLNTFKNNYGYEWDGKEQVHIDHIIPLAIANTEEEVIKLCYYTNLQLLKAKDNLQKSCKII